MMQKQMCLKVAAIALSVAVSIFQSELSLAADLKVGIDLSLTGGTEDYGKAAQNGALPIGRAHV